MVDGSLSFLAILWAQILFGQLSPKADEADKTNPQKEAAKGELPEWILAKKQNKKNKKRTKS